MQLKAAIDEFILYIQVEKNYSTHTVVSYEYDLLQFLPFLLDHDCSTDLASIRPMSVALSSINWEPTSKNRVP
ncbi:Phage integrase, N-terminal SAM-like domain [Bacillus sp. OV322]|nr:Phage integrase, N-terminal SAM-like domain [Bacillus sp. OV322]